MNDYGNSFVQERQMYFTKKENDRKKQKYLAEHFLKTNFNDRAASM